VGFNGSIASSSKVAPNNDVDIGPPEEFDGKHPLVAGNDDAIGQDLDWVSQTVLADVLSERFEFNVGEVAEHACLLRVRFQLGELPPLRPILLHVMHPHDAVSDHTKYLDRM